MGLKLYNGTDWKEVKDLKSFNGTDWKRVKQLYRWTGSVWELVYRGFQLLTGQLYVATSNTAPSPFSFSSSGNRDESSEPSSNYYKAFNNSTSNWYGTFNTNVTGTTHNITVDFSTKGPIKPVTVSATLGYADSVGSASVTVSLQGLVDGAWTTIATGTLNDVGSVLTQQNITFNVSEANQLSCDQLRLQIIKGSAQIVCWKFQVTQWYETYT